MKALVTGVLLVLLITLGAIGFLWSCSLDVSAINSPPSVIEWAVHTVMQRSVRAHASAIQAPTNLADQAAHGAGDFDEMCVQCHGAPGKERGEIGKGLTPRPPSLIDAVPLWSSSELFWIVKNGIQMTGMPAFGPTHDDDRIWAIVSFVQQLPRMSPTQYGQRTSIPAEPPHSHEHHDHDHAH